MTDTKPTDAAILRGFQKFEEGLNVALAMLRSDEGPYMSGQTLGAPISKSMDDLYRAHGVYRKMATAALERNEATKAGKR